MNRQPVPLAQPKSSSPMRGGLLQRKCACGQHASGGECEECRKKKERLQRQKANGAEPAEAPPIIHDVLRSPGQPLDAQARAFFEHRFGHDFSGVRVHTDAQAARSAQAVQASAYTVGRDVVFGAGQYAVGTCAGNRLLAHELAHTLQQGSERPGQIEIAPAYGPHEDEANRLAEVMTDPAAVLSRKPMPAVHAPKNLHRQPAPDGGSATPAGPASGEATSPSSTQHSAQKEKCALDKPKACATYQAWLDTFPAMSGTADRSINSSMPADLAALITGKLSASGGLPDCADVALLLRHYYLNAHSQSFSFMVGRDKKTAETFTLGSGVSDKEARACLIGAGTESFQEQRAGFSLVSFYREKGKNLLNLKKLITAGLKAGDMFVWKRLPSKPGSAPAHFQGHAQTVQAVIPSKSDPKDASKIIQEGSVTVVQGNMSSGKGVGMLQQRIYTASELTGRQDGDADIKEEPRHHEEFFFGAGPWRA
jgi:hypothetical protein